MTKAERDALSEKLAERNRNSSNRPK